MTQNGNAAPRNGHLDPHNGLLDYEILGDEGSPALVLLHAGGLTRHEWDPHRPAWSSSFRLIMPTALGHGSSPRTADLTMAAMAESVIHLLDHLGISKAHILGSSMGGLTALHLAVRHPKRVDRLILYRTGYRVAPEMRETIERLAAPENWRRWGLDRWMSREHAPQGGPEAWKEVIRAVSRLVDPRTSDVSLGLHDLTSLKQPTLMIAGDRDDLAPLTDLLAMAKTIPNAALWITPRSGHIMAVETWRRAAFEEEVRRFLLRVDGGSDTRCRPALTAGGRPPVASTTVRPGTLDRNEVGSTGGSAPIDSS